MNTKYLRKFRAAFKSYDWNSHSRRMYAIQWVRQVRALGPRWRALP